MKIKLKDNKLKIMQLTDTHFGDFPLHEDDFKTLALFDKMINEVKPDLIIHTGDIMWSDGVKEIEKTFNIVMEKLDSFKIPVAFTFGNHEAESYFTKEQFKKVFENKVEMRADKNNVYTFNNKDAYTVEIFDENDEIVNVLYLIDSGINDPKNFGEYDYVDPEHVEWFKKVSEKYKKKDRIKRNIVFQHIPLVEHWEAKQYIIDGGCYEEFEAVSSPVINTGLFANMLINQETWGISVGHDHDNNYDSILHDTHLIYGQVSGYQAYGSLNRGCRIFEITNNPFKIETYRIEYNLEVQDNGEMTINRIDSNSEVEINEDSI